MSLFTNNHLSAAFPQPYMLIQLQRTATHRMNDGFRQRALTIVTVEENKQFLFVAHHHWHGQLTLPCLARKTPVLKTQIKPLRNHSLLLISTRPDWCEPHSFCLFWFCFIFLALYTILQCALDNSCQLSSRTEDCANSCCVPLSPPVQLLCEGTELSVAAISKILTSHR